MLALGADRFIPMPDAVIRAMLEGALKSADAHEPAPTLDPRTPPSRAAKAGAEGKKLVVVVARKPTRLR